MKKALSIALLISIVMITGCLWEETDYEREQRLSGADTEATEPATPAWVENWFYREFGDPATFPDLVDATDRDTVLAVADWVNGFTLEATGADHQYYTTGETVAAGGGDSSSLAWLNFHACRENGIQNVSVELVVWDAGTEEYVCIWRDGGSDYVIDGNALVLADTFLGGIGSLAYGFDEIDYWEYE